MVNLLDTMLADEAQRQRLIGAYVRDQLQPELLADLEVRLMNDERLLADVEAEYALRATLRSLPEKAVLGNVPVIDSMARARRWSVAGGFAAGVAAALAGVWISGPLRTGQDALPSALVSFSDVRGVESNRPRPTRSVELDPALGYLVLDLPAPSVQGPYQVLLSRAEDGFIVVRSPDLAADANGRIAISVRSPLLAVGRYRVAATGAGAAAREGDTFTLEVRRRN